MWLKISQCSQSWLLLFVFLPTMIHSHQFHEDIPVFTGTNSLMDMWEPMIAHDPSTDSIYIFATNNYGLRGCVDCGSDPILYRKTSNNGKSWDLINDFTWEYLDRGDGIEWTADAVVVIDNDGVLYSTYMTGWNISFSKSVDHGKTWSDRLLLSGELTADKNWISIDPIHQNKLYTTFNSRLPYEVHSSDSGTTWSQPKLLDNKDEVYYFGCGSVVRSDGTAFYAYGAIADENSTSPSYALVYGSSDGFQTIKTYEIDYWMGLQSCPEWAGCEPDFLNGGCSLSIDKDDNIYYIYNAYPDHGVNPVQQGIYLSYLTPTSLSFTSPILVSDTPTSSTGVTFVGFPMVAGGLDDGDVRITWMDNRTGMWNIWYRSSDSFFDPNQGGGDEEPSIRLSTYDKLSAFQDSDGFEFPYGDYGMMIVDKKGYSHVVWGEGLGWYAGGTVMYATQAPTQSDNNSDGISQTSIIAISVVTSFIGGSILTAFFIWLMLKRSGKDSLL